LRFRVRIVPIYYLFTTYLLYNWGVGRLAGREEATRMQAVVYVGHRLKALRIEAALTQAELAKEAGVAVNTVAELERDEREPHMSTARKLAEALGVHPRELTVARGSRDA
jgi:DNA-binding XRE family transcriptional regulator